MEYSKPKIAVLESVFEAIKTVQLDKSVYILPERDPHSSTMSAGAYEADE
jgi:hypothetical protein